MLPLVGLGGVDGQRGQDWFDPTIEWRVNSFSEAISDSFPHM